MIYRFRYIGSDILPTANKMLTGYLRLIVMRTLADRKLSGYDLIKQIEKDTGTWKPSFGSIYPLLEKLLKEKLVQVEAKGRRKIYSLTKEGKKELEIIDRSKNSLVDKMIATWKAFGRIADEKDKNFMIEVFNSLKKGQLPFKNFNPELSEFRGAIFEAYSSGKNSKKIKIILRDSIKKIKSAK